MKSDILQNYKRPGLFVTTPDCRPGPSMKGQKMLNPEEIIRDAGALLLAFKSNFDKPATIGLLNGKVTVYPTAEKPAEFTPVMSLTEKQMNEGLTSFQWNKLGIQLDKAIKEYNRCQEHPKP